MPMHLALALLALTPPVAASGDIVVTAPCRLTARQLRPALKAFRSGRAARAPRGILYFETDPSARRLGVGISALRLRARGAVLPISADGEGRFLLPSPGHEDWEIVGPCHDGALAISPLVMSPGTSAADRRLGDMRLQCDVGWAIAREQISLAGGVFMRVTGGCKSSRVAIHAASARPIAGAEVVAGPVTLPVRVRADRYGYSVPLGARRVPDEARVRFRFSPGEPIPSARP